MFKSLPLLLIIVVTIVVVTITSCNTAFQTTTTTTPTTTKPIYLFILIPHEPGESPMIPHPRNVAYKTCDLCHIDESNLISSIKIDRVHRCDECHNKSADYDGSCQQEEPVNKSCILKICHIYP